jgi:ribosomal protein L11 methylase PrmA
LVSRSYPALDISFRHPEPGLGDLVLALVDEDRPFAVEETDDGLRVFFASDAARAGASSRLIASNLAIDVAPVDVPDDDWAVKGQPALEPVQVGRLVIVPREKTSGMFFGATEKTSGMFFDHVAENIDAEAVVEKHTRRLFQEPEKHTRRLFVPPSILFIPPSMGFGTGHHVSTRLCLAALQRLPLHGRRVLDVGTGSGILAIAAYTLGAASALGIDYDADALTAAAENVDRNDAAPGVTLHQFDLDRETPQRLGRFDVVLANLTGGHLEQRAGQIAAFVAPGGHLIVSGFQVRDARDVRAALEAAGLDFVSDDEDEGWMAALLSATPTASTAS